MVLEGDPRTEANVRPWSMTDRGQIVVSWLLKVVLGLAVAGLILFEVVGVVLARGTAEDTAAKAAQDAGFTYRDTGDVKRAEATAKAYAENEGAEFISLSVDEEARTTTVTVRKKARTFFIQYIGPLKKYTSSTGTQSAPLPS